MTPAATMSAQPAPQRESRQWLLTAALFANVVLAIAAAALPLRRLLEALDSNDWWSYQAAEWLINYGGGPVRRGLAGEILLGIPGVDGRVAVTVLVGFLVVAVPTLYAVLIGSVVTTTKAVWPVLLWAVPGGVFLGLWQGQWIDLPDSVLLFATRKEHAFLLLLLVFALVATSIRGRAHVHRWALVYGLSLMVMAWVHEGLTFVYAIAGAVVALIVVTTARVAGVRAATTLRERAGAVLMVLVPAGLGVVATLPFAEPSDAQLEQMWAAVDDPTREWLGGQLPGPFVLMGYSFTEAREYAGGIVFNSRGIVLWAVLAFYVVGWTCAALILTDCSRAGVQATLLIAGVMCVAVVPMLPVAIDWGRFIVIAAGTTAVVALARQRLTPPSARPAPLSPTTIIVAVIMLVLLASVGIPEAGAPFGE